jgi:hypothetical protein
VEAFRRTAILAFILAIAVVVIGGLPGRRVERDEARCWVYEILDGPFAIRQVARANPFSMMIDALTDTKPAVMNPNCVSSYVTRERPASGPELRILAGFLALCALLAAVGRAGVAMTLIVTLGLAGVVITFVTTRALDSPFDETMRMWPYYAVRVGTAGLALATVALLVIYVRRLMKV